MTAPVSLPLPDAKIPEESSLPTTLPPHIRLREDSKIRETAIKIVFLESTNMSREEIAKTLGISPKTISGYLYKAGKNGWLDFDDPKDQLEYRLMHKVIRNIDESLDDEFRNEKTGMRVKTAVALKVAEGALYPKLATFVPQQASTVVGVKIQIVGGEPGTIREGSVMGTSRYVDAETLEPHES